jgi:hypothetical protein
MPSRRLARCANSPDRTEHDRPHVTPACGPTEVRGGASRPHRSPMRLAAPSGPVGPSIAEATAQSRQRDLFIAPASAVAGMATGAPESQGRRIPSLRRVKHRGHQSHRPPPQAEVKPPAALLLIPSTQQGTPHGTTDSCWTHPPCRRCTERPPRRACWRDISAHGGEDHRRGNAGDRRPFPRCSPQKQRGDCYSSKDGNAIELAGRWVGGLAAAPGLTGECTPEQLFRLLDGCHPLTGERLVYYRADRVSAHDLTFSAPKSVSAIWAVADDRTKAAIEHAQEAAADEALDYIAQPPLPRKPQRPDDSTRGRCRSLLWPREAHIRTGYPVPGAALRQRRRSDRRRRHRSVPKPRYYLTLAFIAFVHSREGKRHVNHRRTCPFPNLERLPPSALTIASMLPSAWGNRALWRRSSHARSPTSRDSNCPREEQRHGGDAAAAFVLATS